MKMVQTVVSTKTQCKLHNYECEMHKIVESFQDQFNFLHDAMLESVTCGDTEISSGNLRLSMRKREKINFKDNMTTFESLFKVCTYVYTGHVQSCFQYK